MLCGACQGRDNGPWGRRGNRLDRGKVAVRGDGEAGLDHVHAESIQLQGQTHFLLRIHAAARRLLAVPQSSIENSDSGVIHGTPPPVSLTMLRVFTIQAKVIILLTM